MDTRYRLKKNLPFAKVGEIFRQTFDKNDNNNVYMLQEKYLKYLKAKEIIKQDTKGFKPDWENPSQKRFFGYFNMIDKTLCHFNIGENRESKIFFGSEEDIKESFKKHPKEWKVYLTYEQ